MEEFVMENMEEIRKMLAGVGVTVEEALKNFDANMKALNRLASPEPQLIQGYTAEQWQEIIDGGYLCEYWGGSYTENCGDKPIGTLEELKSGEYPFQQGGNCSDWSFCRPAQLKGVMRPIFVEPVEVDVLCLFFNEGGYPLGNKLQLSLYKDYTEGHHQDATKYIEL